MSVTKLSQKISESWVGFDACDCKKEDSVNKLVQEWIKICADMALCQRERKSTYCFYLRQYISEHYIELRKKILDYSLLGIATGGFLGFVLSEIDNANHLDRFTGLELGAFSGAAMSLLLALQSQGRLYFNWKAYREYLDNRQVFTEIVFYSSLSNEPIFHCFIDRQVPFDAYRSRENPQQLYDYANLKNWISSRSIDPVSLQPATLNDYAPCIYTQALIASELKKIMISLTDGMKEKGNFFDDLETIYTKMERDLKERTKNGLQELDSKITFPEEYLARAKDFLTQL